MLLYEGGRRLYLFAMTENMRYLMRRWQKQLFPEDLKREKGIVERDIWSAATLYELDDAYSRKMADVESVEEFYRENSSCNYFDGVSVPMAFVNSTDDPIIPPSLLDVIKESRLIIPSATFSDAGTYKCSTIEGRRALKSLEVTVKVLPRKYAI